MLLNLGGGRAITPDQQYFLNPVHGEDRGVQVHYNAIFGPGFENAAGVTFGRRIYLRGDSWTSNASTPLLQDTAFRRMTKLLLHEFMHVKQYEGYEYDDAKFGVGYMKGYCKVSNGFTVIILNNSISCVYA